MWGFTHTTVSQPLTKSLPGDLASAWHTYLLLYKGYDFCRLGQFALRWPISAQSKQGPGLIGGYWFIGWGEGGRFHQLGIASCSRLGVSWSHGRRLPFSSSLLQLTGQKWPFWPRYSICKLINPWTLQPHPSHFLPHRLARSFLLVYQSSCTFLQLFLSFFDSCLFVIRWLFLSDLPSSRSDVVLYSLIKQELFLVAFAIELEWPFFPGTLDRELHGNFLLGL